MLKLKPYSYNKCSLDLLQPLNSIISPPPSPMAFSFNNDCSPPPHSSDDISLFLRQLLHRSSSSTPASSLQPTPLAHSVNHNVGFSSSSSAPPDSSAALDGYLRLPSHSVLTSSDPDRPLVADHLPPNAGLSYWREIPAGVCSNLTSSSTAPLESDSPTAGSIPLRNAENDVDDYDCDSEDGPEEAQPKYNPQRNSSKRARAAEVHNQSEKRRRSRINEKMKALQNLIPNSNKTDKASMLDEAIEYLKQLQLQVQMLSMRNGLALHPICLPGFPGVLDPVQLCQLGLDFSNRDGSLDGGIPNVLPSDRSHPFDPSTRLPLDSLPNAVTKEVPFSLQSSMANQLSSFRLLSSSQNICGEDNMAQPQTNALVSNFGTQGILRFGSSNTSHIQLISSNNVDGVSQGTTVYEEV